MLAATGVKIDQYKDGEGLICQRDIPKFDTILAVPLTELLCIETIKRENLHLW